MFAKSIQVSKFQLLKHRRGNNKTQSKYLENTIHNYMKSILDIILEAKYRYYIEA